MYIGRVPIGYVVGRVVHGPTGAAKLIDLLFHFNIREQFAVEPLNFLSLTDVLISSVPVGISTVQCLQPPFLEENVIVR